MKRFLFAIGAVTFLFSVLSKAEAQSNQTVVNGAATAPVNFTGTGCVYNWVNNTPGIGLPASGTGNIAAFNAINNGSSPITASITATPVSANFGYFAYIANAGSNTVSVINTATNTVAATVQVGATPLGIAVSPDGSRVYVTGGSISIINTTTNTVVNTIYLTAGTTGISVSPDGSKLYVASAASVSVLNSATGTQIAYIQLTGNVPGLLGETISPDGARVYVAASNLNNLSVLNTTTNTVVATIPVGTTPFSVAISPDGSKVYVANSGSNSVSVINTATNTVIDTIATGLSPRGVAVSADGSRLYIANANSNNVSVINTTTFATIATIAVNAGPSSINLSPDGTQAYVLNSFDTSAPDGGGTVSVINTATDKVTAIVPVGIDPLSVGNFIAGVTPCAPVTFTITVNPTTPPAITAGTVTGSISACAGTASASPYIQQFSVAGSGLTANIKAAAPTGFEVSLTAGNGYAGSVSLTPQPAGGIVSSTAVYVRSSASATGNISGNVVLSSTGATSQNVAVTGAINALPAVNTVPNQTVQNGMSTTAINFTGTGNTYTWVNNTPGIGIAASDTGNIASFKAINKGSSPVTATITATPTTAGLLYLANDGSKNVYVINTGTNQVVDSIPLGLIPYNTYTTSMSQDGSRLYVTNGEAIAVINTATNKVSSTISVPGDAAAVSPDGSRLYVTNDDNSANGNIITVVNITTNEVVSTIPGFSSAPAVSPDGSKLYVATSGNTISVINTATYAVTATITVDGPPTIMLPSPDGSRLYVDNGDISIINTATNTVIAADTLYQGLNAMALSPDGSRLYVTNYEFGQPVYLTVINTATNTVVSTIPMDFKPWGIVVSPDGSRVYVTSVSGVVMEVNTATNTAVCEFIVDPQGSGANTPANFITGGIACSGAPVTFTITVNPIPLTINYAGALAALNTTYGTASSSTSFIVSGAAMNAGILVTPPPGFEVSTDSVTFSSTVTVGAAGNIASTPVYVRLAATTAVGSYSGNIVLSSTGAASVNVATVNSTVNPITIIATGTLSALTTGYGTASSSTTFTVSGSDMSAGILVTPPPGFEVSADDVSFSSSVTVGAAGNIIATPVYIRLAATTAVGSYSGNIILSSAGAANVNVVLATSTVYPVPSILASGPSTFLTGDSVILTASTGTGYTYIWTNNGIDINGATGSTFTASESGSYTVSIIVGSNRISSAAIIINVVFTLPPGNFEITLTSATCLGSDDGSVHITAGQSLSYTATITGNGLNAPYPFTDSLTISNLAAGTYSICVTIANQSSFQQCYDLVITQPQDLSAYTTVNSSGNTVDVALNGATSYNIQLNGQPYTTTSSSISLPLKVGNNDLIVSTDKPCQGTIEKLINGSGIISPYPVPFQNTLNLNLGNTNINNVTVQISNVQNGKLVYSSQYVNQSGVLQLDLSNLNMGVYALYLTLDGSEKIFKISKQ